jgi:O-antigen ligase/Tfp pilus assembly protein PilF
MVIVLAILVWTPLALGGVRLIDFAPVVVLTAVALSLWVVRFWTQRPFRLFWPPVCWAVYAFVAYALVRAQFVDIPFLAKRELLQVIVYGVLFVVIANNLNHRNSAEIFTVTMVTLGMALSIFAIYQFATHSPWVSIHRWAYKPFMYLNRGSGTFINPNNFAGFLELLVPLGVSYVFLSRMSATAKVLVGYATAMMVAGLCVSLSRGALAATVGSLVLLCVVLLFEGGYVIPALFALIAILGLAVGVRERVDFVARRFDKTAKPGEINLEDRQLYWQTATKVFDAHKLWGAGPAQFDEQYYLYRPVALQTRLIYAHNEYLNTLADWGASGLALIAGFLGLLGFGAWRAWRGIRRKTSDIGFRQSDKGAFVLGGACAVVAAVIHCVVDFDMHVPADALLAVAIMALLAAHGRFVTEGYWKNPGDIGKIVLTLAALAAALVLAFSGVNLAREQQWIERADMAERVLNKPLKPDATDADAALASAARVAAFKERAEDLKKAYEVDPTDAIASYRLGESYWDLGSQADQGYQRDTLEAMQWYSRALLANPLDHDAWTKYGICLDWLDRHREADAYFNQAIKLDPNGWETAFYDGRHLVELNELSKASNMLHLAYNRAGGAVLPYEYMIRIDKRLAENPGK